MAKHYETDHDYSTLWAESNGEELVLRVQTRGTKEIKEEIRIQLYSLQDVIDIENAVKAIRRAVEERGK